MSDRMSQEEFDARMDAGEDPYGIVADDHRRFPRTAEYERLRAEVFRLRVQNERLRTALEQVEFAARAALGETDDE